MNVDKMQLSVWQKAIAEMRDEHPANNGTISARQSVGRLFYAQWYMALAGRYKDADALHDRYCEWYWRTGREKFSAATRR